LIIFHRQTTTVLKITSLACNARKVGARGMGFHSIVGGSSSLILVWLALIAFVAPVTHPASSCSQVWSQVPWQGVCCFVRFRAFSPHCIRSICYSSCKQLLAGVVAGPVTGGVSFCSFHSFPYIQLSLHSYTCYPPHEQLLVGIVAGAGGVIGGGPSYKCAGLFVHDGW
jgi:hypothetical protein